jgi:hypothetical protein
MSACRDDLFCHKQGYSTFFLFRFFGQKILKKLHTKNKHNHNAKKKKTRKMITIDEKKEK